MMSDPSKAVFLSHASQDAEEVWVWSSLNPQSAIRDPQSE